MFNVTDDGKGARISAFRDSLRLASEKLEYDG